MFDWPEKPEPRLSWKILGIFGSWKPAQPQCEWHALWGICTLLFKSGSCVLSPGWVKPSFPNPHLSPAFLVSFYPQAPNMLEHECVIFFNRMTISHSLALKRANCEMFWFFLHWFKLLPLCVSESRKNEWYLLQVQKWFAHPENNVRFQWIKIGHDFKLLKVANRSLDVSYNILSVFVDVWNVPHEQWKIIWWAFSDSNQSSSICFLPRISIC